MGREQAVDAAAHVLLPQGHRGGDCAPLPGGSRAAAHAHGVFASHLHRRFRLPPVPLRPSIHRVADVERRRDRFAGTCHGADGSSHAPWLKFIRFQIDLVSQCADNQGGGPAGPIWRMGSKPNDTAQCIYDASARLLLLFRCSRRATCSSLFCGCVCSVLDEDRSSDASCGSRCHYCLAWCGA